MLLAHCNSLDYIVLYFVIDQQIERHVPTNIAKLATHKLKIKLKLRQEHSQLIVSKRTYGIYVLKNINSKSNAIQPQA